ncbi:uncharacterized protein LOC125712394 isoform X2 [Brienomyrus brachyistius]|uniref:uncharacterized protein LOC125712394 isoform X2 n=1 Tax=Brienomyrus brachyistius TaxID=42636 RepID=UPI0020B24533|nr:uncharacterized protein LOC125712394 isoform X2 [Brienomyrus brachyistius]
MLLNKIQIWVLSILLYCNVPTSCGHSRCNKACEITALVKGTINSAVLLPCNITVYHTETVMWSQAADLVTIRTHGYVNFFDNREGRVKTFPYLSNKGNFSIRLEHLQQSDLGIYCCEVQGGSSSACNKVNVTLDLEENLEGNSVKRFLAGSWYYIAAAGVLVLIALIVICACHMKRRSEPDDADYVNEGYTGSNEPMDTVCGQMDGEASKENQLQSSDVQQSGNPVTIYENNEHDPSWTCVREINSYQNTISTSRTQHITEKQQYVNQSEIVHTESKTRKNKRSLWRRKANDSIEYKNPIYSNSREQLHEL